MMNSTNGDAKNGTNPSIESQSQGKRVDGKDVYDWALYELSSARRVESAAGIDTSDLRQQVVLMLQKDLYEWMGDDLTI